MALRAAVRAHVTASQIELGADKSTSLRKEAQSYFNLAIALLGPPLPVLIAIGGLSGSGKSTIAEALAPHVGRAPGARIFESDRIRKAMFGVKSNRTDFQLRPIDRKFLTSSTKPCAIKQGPH